MTKEGFSRPIPHEIAQPSLDASELVTALPAETQSSFLAVLQPDALDGNPFADVLTPTDIQAHPSEERGMFFMPDTQPSLQQHHLFSGQAPEIEALTFTHSDADPERNEPVLTSDQLYSRDLQEIPKLTNEERAELEQRARSGDQKAKTALIEDCLHHVKGVAIHYATTYGGNSPYTEYMELLSIGNYALVEQFDKAIERAEDMSAYLKGCARWEIKRHILFRNSLIPIPGHTDFLDKKVKIERLTPLEAINIPAPVETETHSKVYEQHVDNIPDWLNQLTEKQLDTVRRHYGIDGRPEESIRDITIELTGDPTKNVIYGRHAKAIRRIQRYIKETAPSKEDE
jgi:DNA-directed RNA polymerase sigma subunit (sigma70/sigma32)